MSSSELAEHAGYLSDENRRSSYEEALSSLLKDRSSAVLDLGSGSGILGLMAARAGARVVYAVDTGSIIGPAAEVARQTPFGDRIIHIRGLSTEVELPEKADLAVCDQVGGLVHDAGILEFFADARRRLMNPDGVLVPAGFRLFLAPAECATIRSQIDVWGSSPAGFDFSAFRELSVNTEHHVDGDQVRLLAPEVPIAEIRSDHTDPITGDGITTVAVAGRCDGIVGWFDADMGGGATLSNRPGGANRIARWCNFYPIRRGINVLAGDPVALGVDVRPLLHAVTWRVNVGSHGTAGQEQETHSTLMGTFVASDDLARAAGRAVISTPLGRVVARMLDLADGTHSTEEVMTQLRREHPNALESTSVDRVLRSTLERFSVLPNAPGQ